MRLPRVSTIAARLLAFNLLLIFLPIAALLSLDVYERKLLEAQERSMVQQGRLLAAALGEHERLSTETVLPILTNLQQRTEARIRVLNGQGEIVADSSHLGPRLEPEVGTSDRNRPEVTLRERKLYRLGALLARWIPDWVIRPSREPDRPDSPAPATLLERPEIRSALSGRYGAATRISAGGQRSVTLHSALPVRRNDSTNGAVLISQSTFRILEALYDIRLRIFQIFLGSVAVATLLTFLLSATIARPLHQLAAQAQQVVDRRGRLTGHFEGSTKRDEIGNLARALGDLTHRLERHLQFIEAFSADLSHELRNPLSSIRASADLLGEVDTDEDRTKFLRIIIKESARMESLLSEAQELSTIDARLEDEERRTIDLAQLVRGVVETFRYRLNGQAELELELPSCRAPVEAVMERLQQVVENLIDNAVSFSPPDGIIQISLRSSENQHILCIADQGPGVPEAHLERIFSRFFSYRPQTSATQDETQPRHSGLGLAIVKAIVEGYGGSVEASNGPPGGAQFRVTLTKSGA